MAIPTLQALSLIIEMWWDLEKAKSTFWKNKAKRMKSAHGKNLDDLSVDELLEKLGYACDPDKPKSVYGLLGAVVRSAVKGEGIPTQFTSKKGKPLSLEDYIGGVKVYFIKGIPAFPTSVLQGLLDQVITPLYRDEEIQTIDEQGKRTEKGKNLDEIRDAVRFELKRRTEREQNKKKQENLIGELATTITKINILRNGWPKKIQDQINKIEYLLSPYWDYFKANGSWGENERRIIEAVLKSKEPKKPKYSPNVILELEKIKYKIEVESDLKTEPKKKAGQDDAYIPFSKAIELSNGILTRKKLEKAIEHGKPTKVRDIKPRKNRRNVHIQDVLLLINKLSINEKASEEAARMFGKWRELSIKKRDEKIDLS